MDLTVFKDSLAKANPPENISVYLTALWYDGIGNWDKAHELIQDLTDRNASLIHAYLHRKEGDVFNSDYWYRKAGKKSPQVSIEQEWENLVSELL